jgi:glycosyltransferase involved in cell wall biosynthesis
MKIGIISEALRTNLTGIGNYVYHTIHELQKINKDIVIIDNTDKNIPNTKNVIIKNPFPFFKTYLWMYYLGILFSSNMNHEKIDLIHNPDQIPFFSKKKNIATVFDLTPIIFPKEHNRKRELITRYILPLYLRNTNKIITISQNTKIDIIKYFKIPEEKIKVIHLAANENYVPIDKYESTKIAKKYGVNNKFIIYVGTLEPRKNIPNLLKSYNILKNYGINHKLIITGKKGWKYKEIFETIEKLKLQNDVIFTGYVPDEDLPGLYNAADLFVYPSLYEGFGLPPLEAMQCGTPVITSNTSSLPEVVGDAGIMVDPYDIDGLASKMYEVLTNEDLRNNMSKKGIERAKLFSWKKCAEEHLKVYEEVYNMKN